MLRKMALPALLLLSFGLLPAEEPKAKPLTKAEAEKLAEAEKAANSAASDIEDITTAYRLAEFGEKNNSPEALITAASLLRKVAELSEKSMTTLKTVPTGEKEEAINDESLKTPKLQDDIDRFFKAASALADADPKLSIAVEALIKDAKARKYKEEGNSRGAVGGPKNVTRTIAPGGKHFYRIAFVTGIPGAFGFRAAAPLRCEMAVGGYVHFNQVVRFGNYSWTPKPNGGVGNKVYVIEIHNRHNFPVTYTFFTN